jgi:hypothetical protein
LGVGGYCERFVGHCGGALVVRLSLPFHSHFRRVLDEEISFGFLGEMVVVVSGKDNTDAVLARHRYFWTEVWKRERASGGRNWLETPRFLFVLFPFSSPFLLSLLSSSQFSTLTPSRCDRSVKLLDPPSRLEELEAADRARETLVRQMEIDRLAAEGQRAR